LFFKPSESTSDELGRNVPDENRDGFGNSFRQPAEYIPFELERPVASHFRQVNNKDRLVILRVVRDLAKRAGQGNRT
jgi:hypothetical protein